MSVFFFFFKQKTAYEMRISDWSSDVCSSDLSLVRLEAAVAGNLDGERLAQLAGGEGDRAAGQAAAQEVTAAGLARHRVVDGAGGRGVAAARHGEGEGGAAGVALGLDGVVGGDGEEAGRRRRIVVEDRAGGAVFAAADSAVVGGVEDGDDERSEEHTSELQSLMRISYAVFCLKKKT